VNVELEWILYFLAAVADNRGRTVWVVSRGDMLWLGACNIITVEETVVVNLLTFIVA